MDLPALEATLIPAPARSQRADNSNEPGRHFTAELTQAMRQRRQEAEARSEAPRFEDQANDRPEPTARGDVATEAHSRRQAEAAARQDRRDQGRSATVRQDRRDQDRTAADETDRARAAGATTDSDAADEVSIDVGEEVVVDNGSDPNQPAAVATAIDKTADGTDAKPAAIAIVPAPVVGVEVASQPATDLADSEITPVADAAAATAADVPDGHVPMPVDLSASDPTAPADGVPVPAATVAPTPAPAAASGPDASAPAVAPTTAVIADPAPQPQANARQTDTVNVGFTTDAAATAAASTEIPLAAAPTPTSPDGPTIAKPAPATGPAVTVAVATEALPVTPAVPAFLALQSVDEPAMPAAPVENAPAPTATVTAAAVQPTGQSASAATQTPDPNLAPTSGAPAPTAAPANTPAFAETIDEAVIGAETVVADRMSGETSNLAQSGTERRASVEQSIRAEPAQPARQNLPPQPVADQIAVRIAKQTQAGEGRISLQLRPETLGIVDVDIEVRRDGTMRAVISVEKPETLEWLKRDAQHLERALQDVGVKTDSGSLNFALREQRQDGSGSFARSGGRRGFDADAGTDPAEGRVSEAKMAEAAARRIARGGVDVRI